MASNRVHPQWRPAQVCGLPFKIAVFGGLFAIAAVASLPAVAVAQVLEIGEGGAVKLYDRPAVFDAGGSTPIPSVARRARRRTPSSVQLHSGRTAPLQPAGSLAQAAAAAEVSPDLVEAVAWRESRLRAGVVSRAGAIGEMQLMPSTARDLGVDPFVSSQNLQGGAAYLGGLMRRYDGDLVRALAAYNAGPGTVDRFGGVPPYKETRDYVAAIMDRLSSRLAPVEDGSGR